MRQGLLLTFASAFINSLMSVGVKSSVSSIGQLLAVNAFLLLVSSYALIRMQGTTIFQGDDKKFGIPEIFPYLCISAVEFLNLCPVRLMPISGHAVISYSSIGFTIFFARLFLNEACNLYKVISGCAIFLGLLMVASVSHGDRYPNYLLGCSVALFSALLDSLSAVSCKKFTEHYSVVLFKLSCVELAIFSPMLAFEEWTVTYTILWLPILQCIEAYLYMLAISTEQIGLVTLVHTSDIAFCYIFEMALFDEVYTIMSILGTLLILAAVTITSLVEKESEENSTVGVV